MDREREEALRPGYSWRALFVSVIAAILLAVSAMLVLGGNAGSGSRLSAAGCCPAGAPCCPPAAK